MNKQLGEVLDVVYALPVQNLTGGPVTDPFYEMNNSRRVKAVAIAEQVSAGETLRIQLRQDTDASGTADPRNLGDAVVVTAGTGGEPLMCVAEAHVSDMDLEDGYRFVGAIVTTSAADDGGLIFIFGDNRYNPAI